VVPEEVLGAAAGVAAGALDADSLDLDSLDLESDLDSVVAESFFAAAVDSPAGAELLPA
jgi:hypothetical protein